MKSFDIAWPVTPEAAGSSSAAHARLVRPATLNNGKGRGCHAPKCLATVDISKVDNPKSRRLGHRIGAADRIELVDDSADMELGRMDGDAEPLSNHLV